MTWKNYVNSAQQMANHIIGEKSNFTLFTQSEAVLLHSLVYFLCVEHYCHILCSLKLEQHPICHFEMDTGLL